MGNMLEDVVALKQEYGISSQDAFRYLKSMQSYQRLCDDVNKQFGGNVRKLTLRETANFCELIYAGVDNALSMEQKKRGLEAKTIARHNTRHAHESGSEIAWSFDYESALFNYALGERFLKAGEMEALDATLEVVKKAGCSYFKDSQGRIYSYEDLVNSLPHGKLTKEIEEESRINEEIEVQRKSVIELIYGSGIRVNSTRVMDEEMDFLQGRMTKNSLYNRAVEEATLNRLETERRIAMQEVAIAQYELSFYLKAKPSELIENAEKEILTELKMEGIKPQEKERLMYSLKAVRKNRSWLTRMLNN